MQNINALSDLTHLGDSGFDQIVREGFRSVSAQQATRKRRVREAVRLYTDALAGRIDPFLLKQAMSPTDQVYVEHLNRTYPGLYGNGARMTGLREAMSVTDYQALFVDVVDRAYYGWYNEFPVTLLPAVKQHTCMDFRLVKRYIYDSMVTPFTKIDPAAPANMQNLTGPVPQGGSNLATASTAAVTYQPSASHSGSSIPGAASINDALGIFPDVPRRLAVEGTRGTAQLLSSFFWDINGPN